MELEECAVRSLECDATGSNVFESLGAGGEPYCSRAAASEVGYASAGIESAVRTG